MNGLRERPSILFCVVVARKMWYTNMADSNSCYASGHVGENTLLLYYNTARLKD